MIEASEFRHAMELGVGLSDGQIERLVDALSVSPDLGGAGGKAQAVVRYEELLRALGSGSPTVSTQRASGQARPETQVRAVADSLQHGGDEFVMRRTSATHTEAQRERERHREAPRETERHTGHSRQRSPAPVHPSTNAAHDFPTDKPQRDQQLSGLDLELQSGYDSSGSSEQVDPAYRESTALSPLLLIFLYKSEKFLCGADGQMVGSAEDERSSPQSQAACVEHQLDADSSLVTEDMARAAVAAATTAAAMPLVARIVELESRLDRAHQHAESLQLEPGANARISSALQGSTKTPHRVEPEPPFDQASNDEDPAASDELQEPRREVEQSVDVVGNESPIEGGDADDTVGRHRHSGMDEPTDESRRTAESNEPEESRGAGSRQEQVLEGRDTNQTTDAADDCPPAVPPKAPGQAPRLACSQIQQHQAPTAGG